MKKKFSNSWVSSVQKRKQVKFRINAPLHTKHKFLSANLSKSLRKKHNQRNIPLRKGDEVLVMRGKFKKKKAKISLVDIKNSRVALDGIQRTKKDGTKVNVYFNPSVVQIITLITDDKKRIKSSKQGKISEKSSASESQSTGEKNASD